MKQVIKKYIRSVARIGRVDLVRKPLALLDLPEAQLVFDVEYVIAHALLTKENLTVVQVGANDGQMDDPISRLLRMKQCRGILLEPHPVHFQRLQKTYAGFSNLTLLNVAIGSKDGTATLYALNPKAPGPDWVHGLASFSKEHLLKHDGVVPGIACYIDEVTVECLTFDTLFRRYPVGQIDVLQSDTEGFDAEVLRLFDLPLRKPAIVNFEHRHLSEADWDESVNRLISLGYKVAIVQQDTLGYLPPKK